MPELTRITGNVIANGTITNDDISPSAAIAASKIGAGALPAGVTSLATGSTTARALNDRFADVVNVKDFGATGVDNGTNNDAPAIRAAIAYAVANKKSVYFPSGEYPFKTTTTGAGPFLDNGATGIGILINNNTFLSNQIHIFGDDAKIHDYIYGIGGGPNGVQYKFMVIQGYYSSVSIEGMSFISKTPTMAIAPTKGWSQCIGLMEKSGENRETTSYYIREFKFINNIITDYTEGISHNVVGNSIVSENKFLTTHGRISVGENGLAVGISVQLTKTIVFNNNIMDGCTSGTYDIPSALNLWKIGMDGLFFATYKNNSMTVSGNIVRNFIYEAIVMVYSEVIANSTNQESEFIPSSSITGNTLDATTAINHSRNINCRAIVVDQNNVSVVGNSITNAYIGISLKSHPNGGNPNSYQTGFNCIVDSNVIVLGRQSNMTTGLPGDGSYGTIGIEVDTGRNLISNNKIIGYDVPEGTLGGWNGNWDNKPSSARIPTAIVLTGNSPGGNQETIVESNYVRIITKSTVNTIVAGMQLGQNTKNVTSKNNKFDGCNFIFWSVDGSGTGIYSDSDILIGGTALSIIQNRSSVSFNKNSIWFYPTTTGWYKLSTTNKFSGSIELKISTPNAGIPGITIDHQLPFQSTILKLSNVVESNGSGGFDQSTTINQLCHSSFDNPGAIVTKVAFAHRFGEFSNFCPIWIYVNRIVNDSSGNPYPVLISWDNNVGPRTGDSTFANVNFPEMSILNISLDTSTPASERFVEITLNQGSKSVTRTSIGANTSVIYGYATPILGSAAPIGNAEFSGQTFIDQNNGKIYMSYGVNGPTPVYPYAALN